MLPAAEREPVISTQRCYLDYRRILPPGAQVSLAPFIENSGRNVDVVRVLRFHVLRRMQSKHHTQEKCCASCDIIPYRSVSYRDKNTKTFPSGKQFKQESAETVRVNGTPSGFFRSAGIPTAYIAVYMASLITTVAIKKTT